MFRNDLLHRSETFIKEQVFALTHWNPVLVGYRKVQDGLDLIGVDVRIVPGLTKGKWQRWRLRLCQWLGIAHPPTVRVLRKIGANLVHVHFGTDAVDIWPSVRKLGLPTLVTLHGYDISIYREWWEAGHGGLLRRAYPRRLLRMAKDPDVRFIAVSQAIMDRAIEYGIPAGKITVSYIGVDTQRFKAGGLPLDQRHKRILFVGRMVEKKAPLLMVRAYAEVRKNVLTAELAMIGDGPLLSDAKTLSAELKAPVEFFGACTTDEVLAQLHEAKVFCLPSVIAMNGDAEGFGLVILEAQACGVPVVTSALGGAKEGVLGGETGCAFDEHSMQGLVGSLLFFLENDQVALRASAAATRFMEACFDIRLCTRKLENIYEELANGLGHA